MGKTMLFCVSLAVLLPLMATEVSTGLLTTVQPNPGTQEGRSDSSNQPTAKAMAIATPMVTTPPTSITQTIANLKDATVPATKDVQTSPIYSNEKSTTNPNSTSKSKGLAMSTVENAEISTTNIKATQSAISSMILSASSGYTSSMQTSTMKMETPKVVAPTERATRSVPTAKLSATTQYVLSLQSTANASKTTKPVMTTNFIQTLALSTTTQLVPPAQKTTMKPAQTTRRIYPPVVTKGLATTSSKTLKETEEEAIKGVKHGKIVAGLIGGALLAMMIGFLVILYKKHKLKKHQIATSDWAGPTPFLETGGSGGGDNGHVTLRAASRISLTSFLPQRLSKRLSLLAESAEEMQDMQEMTTGTTFAANEEKNMETKSDQATEKSMKETNGNNLESSENVVLVDEVTANETSKDKQNGQATMQDGENGQLKHAPAPKEDAPIELNDENKEQIEKDGADNDA